MKRGNEGDAMKALGLKLALVLMLAGGPLAAGSETARRIEVVEWKAVFARIETRDQVPARSRLGGVIEKIDVSEGDHVARGQVIGRVKDDKLLLQREAIDSQLRSLESQLANARTELDRGENLLRQGVATKQRVDALRTQVDVLVGQIDTVQAEREVVLQRVAEGAVLAPIRGRILSVPVTAGSVIMPGEPVALIGGGGVYLRLAVPERHAESLRQGDDILIGHGETDIRGTLVKLYPMIENGRVIADVEVEGLATDFVNARVLVRLPVGTKPAVVVPAGAVQTRMGLDFVAIRDDLGASVDRAVVLGETHAVDGAAMIEILSGLAGGETLVMHDEQ
ncbi:efflux RND transporter periplasmic adaptor subunit [Shimia sp.]|uniref:efflux RND transporter periplasmic adaptor subunit n=1 Tax=Shimia sp. TaxID=1954381 RepID=UPI0035648A60